MVCSPFLGEVSAGFCDFLSRILICGRGAFSGICITVVSS
ncbi:hypothetical protein PU02_0318 [Bartonella ancashensis]|uniref:Uncharacterized protein n=1 Tax=Bartonella ancashensis TaxID=1318743 RepID=A0A0M4LFR9_9HYPH|nr:hypothetical protein PU02_0318 [Bartonella ancashensis]